jgi:hypothetical protein
MTLAYSVQHIRAFRFRALALLAVGVASLLPLYGVVASQPSDAKRTRLLWVVRIGDDPEFGLHSKNPLPLERATIAFLDAQHLVVSFHDGRPWIPPFSRSGKWQNPTEEEAEKEFGYHALFLSAPDGTILRRMTWKTKNDNSLLLPTGDGGFLLLAGQKLTLYDSKFQAIHEMAIPAKPRAGRRRSDFWSARVSPDNKVFVLAHTVEDSTTYQWLTIPDFNQLGTAQLHGFGPFSCSETQIARAWVPNIMIATRGKPFVPSCNQCKAYDAEFLDNEHMVILRRPDFQVLTISGEQLAGGELENTVQFVSNAPSAQTFALGSTNIIGGEWIFTVRVFNWKTAQMLTTMKIRKEQARQTGWDYGFGDLGLALSPDGDRFAVFRDGVLEMYAVQ